MYIKLKKIEDNNMVFDIFDKKDDFFFYIKILRYIMNLKQSKIILILISGKIKNM